MRLDRAGRTHPSPIALLLLNLAGLPPRYFLDAVTSPPPPPPPPPCRCAVLYSGHVRSFSQRHVHLSHKEHLLEQLKSDCDVDVFMYLSVEDEIPMRYRMGKYADELSFTPHSPQQSAVDHAVRVLNPVSIQFHQDQAGYIPNWCGARCKDNAFWQLYKMRAVYRMIEDHEALIEMPYTWVIRSRLDIGWMLPMPPLSRFPPTRVYAGHNFFPLADQFLLIPRQFAHTVFTAVNLCYACDVLKVQTDSGIPAQTESFLRLALLRGGVPFGYYEFPIVIVRSNEGGVCGVLHPHKLTCQMLQWAGLIEPQAPTDGRQTSIAPCTDAVSRWHRRTCLEMFPPFYDKGAPSTSLQQGSVRFDTAVAGVTGSRGGGGGAGAGAGGGRGGGGSEKDSGGENVLHGVDESDVGFGGGAGSIDEGGFAVGEFGDGRGQEEHRGRTSGGSSAHGQVAPDAGTAVVSFAEATDRLEGVHRSLRELREAIRTYAAPSEPRFTHFFAHHYPFHQTGGGPHDEIAIIEGFRFSETDFNRIARGFACLLYDAEREESEPEEEEACAGEELGDRDGSPSRTTGHHGQNDENLLEDVSLTGEERPALTRGGGGGARNMLRIRTVGAADGGMHAVNCSRVDSLHDVWMALLDQNFDPPELICRGPTAPCLDRVMQTIVPVL